MNSVTLPGTKINTQKSVVILYNNNVPLEREIKKFSSGSVDENPPASAGTWVLFLTWEDFPNHRTIKPVCQTTKAHALEPMLNYSVASPALHCN